LKETQAVQLIGEESPYKSLRRTGFNKRQNMPNSELILAIPPIPGVVFGLSSRGK